MSRLIEFASSSPSPAHPRRGKPQEDIHSIFIALVNDLQILALERPAALKILATLAHQLVVSRALKAAKAAANDDAQQRRIVDGRLYPP